MVTEKNKILQVHNTILQKVVISNCKNDKPWKNKIGKVGK